MAVTMPKLVLPKRETTKVPRSQTERLWLVGGGLVAFVLILIGYFFFISPQRSQTSDVDSQVATAQQQNAQLQARLNALREQNKNLPKYRADLAKARLALPATSGVPDFLRSLQALGGSTQTQITAVTVGPPAELTAPAAAAGTAAASSATASSAAPAPAGAGSVGASPAAGPQIYSLAITANVTGSPAALNKFLQQLQAVQPRAVLITQITEGSGVPVTGAKASATTTLQLTMQAFVAPPAVVVAPSAAPSPSPSGSH